MAVATQTRIAQFLGNGVTTVFACPFLLYETSTLKVTLTDSFGVDTALTTPADWTVNPIDLGNPTGFNLVMAVPPATGTRLTVVRTLPLIQDLDLVTSGTFPEDAVERQLDEIVMMIQQLADGQTQSGNLLTTPLTDPTTLNLQAPPAALRANKVLGFDALGNVAVFANSLLPLATWVTVTGSVTLTPSVGYIVDSAGATFTLPLLATVGQQFAIVSKGSGAWTINQLAGQSIRVGGETTTTGVTGSLASNGDGAGVLLVCTENNLQFTCVNGVGSVSTL